MPNCESGTYWPVRKSSLNEQQNRYRPIFLKGAMEIGASRMLSEDGEDYEEATSTSNGDNEKRDKRYLEWMHKWVSSDGSEDETVATRWVHCITGNSLYKNDDGKFDEVGILELTFRHRDLNSDSIHSREVPFYEKFYWKPPPPCEDSESTLIAVLCIGVLVALLCCMLRGRSSASFDVDNDDFDLHPDDEYDDERENARKSR